MADMLNRLDFYISLIVIGLVVFLWTRRLWRRVMSRWFSSVPAAPAVATELAFPSQEQPLEQPGTPTGNAVPAPVEHLPALVELLTASDDDTLLRALSQVEDEDGEYRWSESKIAKFVGGRTENRMTQIQELRGTTPPPPPGRTLAVRDSQGARVIPFEEAKSA